jgi:hypothetical protein
MRTSEDIFKLLPFGLVLLVCGEFTPLVIPLIGTSVLPKICRREKEQEKDLKSFVKRHEYFRNQLISETTRLNDNHQELGEKHDESNDSPATDFISSKVQHDLYLWWLFVVQGSRLSFLIPYIPRSLTHLMWTTIYAKAQAFRHADILTDIILIVREGGFSKLSPQDIREFCIRVGDTNFSSYAQQCLREGVSPATEQMKSKLAPILDEYAGRMLRQDWTRIRLQDNWQVESFTRFHDPWALGGLGYNITSPSEQEIMSKLDVVKMDSADTESHTR